MLRDQLNEAIAFDPTKDILARAFNEDVTLAENPSQRREDARGDQAGEEVAGCVDRVSEAAEQTHCVSGDQDGNKPTRGAPPGRRCVRHGR